MAERTAIDALPNSPEYRGKYIVGSGGRDTA